MLPKTRAYIKSHDSQIKWMYFLIEDGDLFNKYNTTWVKVSADMIKKEFDSKIVYHKIFENLIKSFRDEDFIINKYLK